MNALVPWLQDAVAAAFVVLGLVTAVSWLRSRDRSLGFLALAIILLAAVSGLGRLQAHLPFMLPWLGVIELAGFMGSAYALLLYRDTIIPLLGAGMSLRSSPWPLPASFPFWRRQRPR